MISDKQRLTPTHDRNRHHKWTLPVGAVYLSRPPTPPARPNSLYPTPAGPSLATHLSLRLLAKPQRMTKEETSCREISYLDWLPA